MFYIRVESRANTLFECYSRVSAITLQEAWAAALPALLASDRIAGATHLTLRIDDLPVLGS